MLSCKALVVSRQRKKKEEAVAVAAAAAADRIASLCLEWPALYYRLTAYHCKNNKAKCFAKQLASLVYHCKAKVLEFPSKKSDTQSENI